MPKSKIFPKKINYVLILCLIFFIGGCASIETRWVDDYYDYPPGFYSGTRQDFNRLRDFFRGDWQGPSDWKYFGPITMPFYATDLVLSAVADTILFPYDVGRAFPL